MRLHGNDIYLDTLEREDCRRLWQDTEYDFANPTEDLNLGHSIEKADQWFEEIQKLQGRQNIRLGIFLKDGTPIGDVALQNIDMRNHRCSIGMGIAKISNRGKGYGQQALALILHYGFGYVGMERITANTLEMNQGPGTKGGLSERKTLGSSELWNFEGRVPASVSVLRSFFWRKVCEI